tara:strand:+ start:37643 stop:38170 length:528 start_codon:yes stop_codon:yes gene_type:complete
MTLAFTRNWNDKMPKHLIGKPTHFPERIWQSIDDEDNSSREEFESYFKQNFDILMSNPFGFDFKKTYHPKLHTIREDKNNRWKPGNDIHFVVNNRRPDRFQFAPVIKCLSTQEIKILHSGEKWRQPWVFVDGAILTGPEIDVLAQNDGFDFTSDFFAYFNTDFTGKIIHWTNLEY